MTGRTDAPRPYLSISRGFTEKETREESFPTRASMSAADDAPPDPDAAADGGTKSGRVRWAPTATLGVQFFRCGRDGQRGVMYGVEDGSSINSDQTGMRIVGISGYVRARRSSNISVTHI